jgi:acyl-CoA synthetase (NDP forming)
MPTLSESSSKQLLRQFGVRIAEEVEVSSADEGRNAATQLDVGHGVVAKLCGDSIAHKTERGLVRLGLRGPVAVESAVASLFAAALPDDGPVTVLIAPMLKGARELIAGIADDAQFGKVVMLGVGGVLAEAIADVVFRIAPITRVDAFAMIDDLQSQKLLGSFRGEPPLDRESLVQTLLALSDVALDPDIASVDINPLIIVDGVPIAVDALVEIAPELVSIAMPKPVRSSLSTSSAHLQALFDPRAVVVVGASTHPGKFGFVTLHNILASGFAGPVFGTNLEAENVLGVQTVRSVDELPDGVIDLAIVCTPASTNQSIVRSCAAKGIKAAFLTSAGYGEAGEIGLIMQNELIALAESAGVLIAGPNGQGVVSTPSKLCAQIVAPFPPTGSIGIASQSGNFVSSFLNWSVGSGIGVSRAVSAGNAAMVSIADYLSFFAEDPATTVGLGYVEGIVDGRAFADSIRHVTPKMPLVLVKGGATEGGQAAAASHTGALAANDKVFDGLCRQLGVNRAATVEEAFDTAAAFATQPLPQGPNVVVLTTAGGWGVVTSDALTRERDLILLGLPDDLRADIDTKLPPRWSRSNPVDLAGAETRDTIPEVMEMIAAHPEVHSIVYLGIGIQSNQAKLTRNGGFYPDHGLDRIVAFHERQDARYAQAAHDLSVKYSKPILTATELAVTDPSNPGPSMVRETGRYCYPTANRAVTALGHMYRRTLWLNSRT